MAETAQDLRQEIEFTQAQVGRDVDAINEKVNPSRIVHRRVERVRGSASSLRERVMGTAKSAASSASDQGGAAQSKLAELPDMARERTEGNPLAAGLLAFAAGWLVSTVAPATSLEKRAGAQLKEKADDLKGPVKEQAAQVASQLKEDLRQPAQEAAERAKDSAQQAAQTVADEGTSSGENVKTQVTESEYSVRDSASGY